MILREAIEARHSVRAYKDQSLAADVREKYSAVRPAWHWNKKHWSDERVYR